MEQQSSISEEELQSILTKLGVRRVTEKAKVVTADGRERNIEKFMLAKKDTELLAVPEIRDWVYRDGHVLDDIRETFVETLIEMGREKATEKEAQRGEDWLPLDHYRPIHDFSSGNVVIFLKNGGKSGMSPNVYAKLKCVTEEEIRQLAPVAMVAYCPDKLEAIFMREASHTARGHNEMVANTYVAPQWKRMDPPDSPTIHPLFEKYFNHLFPILEERKAVFHWLHFSLVSRSQTILCVPGIQGIGKTLLGEVLLRALVGDTNWTKAPRSFVSKEFNSFLKDRKIVLVEEIPTTRSKEDRVFLNEMLKDISNDTVSIEGKGKDSETIENFANVLITSNKLRAIPIESRDDRRFLCVSTAKVKLDTVFTNEEYEQFIEFLKSDSEEMLNFAHWLIANGRISGKNAHYTLKNDIKYQIYRMSLAGWELDVLKGIDKDKKTKQGLFTERDLLKYCKKTRVKISTVEEFLDSFQLPSGQLIGEFTEEGHFMCSTAAMEEDVYVNPRRIKKEIYGVDEAESGEQEPEEEEGL